MHDAVLELARTGFSARLARPGDGSEADAIAALTNSIADELQVLLAQREAELRELEVGLHGVGEALASLAAGRYEPVMPRNGRGDALDALAFLVNNTALEVGDVVDRIRRQHEELETIFAVMVDGLLLVSGDGRISRHNRALGELLGWGDASLAGRTLAELLAGDDPAKLASELLTGDGLRAREVPFRTADGSVLPLSVNGSRLPAPHALVLVARDDREVKRARDQLIIGERLSLMGTIAAGVAHEINNPLAYVSTNLEFLETLVRPLAAELGERGEDLEAALADCLQGTSRVSQIVKDLKALTRTDESTIEMVDLHPLLESALTMLRAELRHRTRVERDFGQPPPVKANAARLGQVFLNLVLNAAQAIPAGAADRNLVRVTTRRSPAGEAIVEISDTGVGIPPEHLSRIFDLFFTTKPIGEGTGLGLAICQKTVTELGGRINVASTVGQGTTFTLTLPGTTVRRARTAAAVRPPVRRGRLLVVDDDRLVAEALQRALGREHEVSIVEHGRAALELLATREFDLIFCDVMMPELSGPELYRRLERERPELAARVVFMTGGAFTSEMRELLAAIPNLCLDKPFEIATLRRLINEALDSNRAPPKAPPQA